MKLVWLSVGWISLTLGVIGIAVPLLPTTPFVLLTACMFSKSSKRCHNWLLSRPAFGSIVLDWERERAISLPTKWTATIMLPLLLIYPLFYKPLPILIKAAVIAVAASVLTFIWSCKTSRTKQAVTFEDRQAARLDTGA